MGVDPVVIKVGGSLFDWPDLPDRLRRFLEARRGRGCRDLLLAGGGPSADVVRTMDRIHALGEDRSHRLAIRTLDLNAEILAELLPGALVVERPEALSSAWNLRLVPILAPSRLLAELDRSGPGPRLPAGWDVTSDSIAAWVARRVGAGALLLLKSAQIAPGTTRRGAARIGLVDPVFPDLAEGLSRVECLTLRDPHAAPVVLEP